MNIAKKMIIVGSAFVLCLIPLTVGAQSNNASDNIDQYIQQSIDQYHIPGMSLSIKKDGKNIIKKSWGETSTGAIVTADTPFLIGSLSKTITAAGVMSLVQDGKVDLDTPIGQYVPDFDYVSGSKSQITVRQLLNQTSGIGAVDGLSVTDREYSENDGIAQAVSALSGVKLQSNPGEKYQYTSANYLLLGSIVESASNQSFSTFINQRLFVPLEMNNSSADQKDSRENGLVAGYTSWIGNPVKGKGFYDNSGAPYGYMSSTINDLTKFLAFMKDGGGVLNEQSMKTLKTVPTDGKTYGFGWHYSADNKFFYHGGATPEYRAEMFYYPDRDFSGVILTNKYHNLEDQQISDIMAGVREIVDGQTPKMLPSQDYTVQLGILAAATLFIGVFIVNLYRYIKGRTSIKLWRRLVGVLLLIMTGGLVYALPLLFGAPWYSIMKFAPDVAYGSILLIVIMVMCGVLLLLKSRAHSETINQ